MLDHYLNIVTESMAKEASLLRFTERLADLPYEELAHVRATGEIKVAYCDDEWIQKFQGSPLLEKAVALAEQQLRVDAERDARRKERNMENDDFEANSESLRLERRLLELELMKQTMGIQSAPAPAPNAGAGAVPTQGKMTSLSPAATLPEPGMKEASSKNKRGTKYDEIASSPSGQAALMSAGVHGLDSLARGRGPGLAGLSALGGYITGKGAGEVGENSTTLGGAALGGMASGALPALLLSSRPGTHALTSAAAGAYAHHRSKQKASETKEASAEADAWGRSLARGELERLQKVAAPNFAGMGASLREGAKSMNLGGLGARAMNFAKSNPGLVAGGVLGAAHGALRDDGGLGSAVLEGAGGAALGAGGQHLYNRYRGGGVPSGYTGMSHQLPKTRTLSDTDFIPPIQPATKVAFGAALAAGVSKALPAVAGWMKSNPLKAGLGAVSAISNFHSARQSGDSLGGALLSGAGGIAGAAL